VLDPKTVNELSKQAANLPTQVASIRSDLAAQTESLRHLEELIQAQAPKIAALPQYLDLTMASPSLVTGETLRFVQAWISAAGAIELTLHIGEAGVFFHFWLPAGGSNHILPISPDYPLIVARGQRVWLETLTQAQDYHCKLVAFPT
jgi:hypothetical protein